MTEAILDFIKRRWQKDANWHDGNCYWFAFILTSRFPKLNIYYLPIVGHFVAGLDGEYFDQSGVVIPEEKPILFSQLRKDDPTYYTRIIRDCVL